MPRVCLVAHVTTVRLALLLASVYRPLTRGFDSIRSPKKGRASVVKTGNINCVRGRISDREGLPVRAARNKNSMISVRKVGCRRDDEEATLHRSTAGNHSDARASAGCCKGRVETVPRASPDPCTARNASSTTRSQSRTRVGSFGTRPALDRYRRMCRPASVGRSRGRPTNLLTRRRTNEW
jgi:hypothetical protein